MCRYPAGMDFDKIKDTIADHKKQVNEGLEKAGGLVKDKFHHDEQVDEGVQKAQDAIDKLKSD